MLVPSQSGWSNAAHQTLVAVDDDFVPITIVAFYQSDVRIRANRAIRNIQTHGRSRPGIDRNGMGAFQNPTAEVTGTCTIGQSRVWGDEKKEEAKQDKYLFCHCNSTPRLFK